MGSDLEKGTYEEKAAAIAQHRSKARRSVFLKLHRNMGTGWPRSIQLFMLLF